MDSTSNASMEIPIDEGDVNSPWMCWRAAGLGSLPIGFGSGGEFGQTTQDKEIAAQAVAFVVSSSRKGIVSLCADVASLLRSRKSLEEKLLMKESEASLRQVGSATCSRLTSRSSSPASALSLTFKERQLQDERSGRCGEEASRGRVLNTDSIQEASLQQRQPPCILQSFASEPDAHSSGLTCSLQQRRATSLDSACSPEGSHRLSAHSRSHPSSRSADGETRLQPAEVLASTQPAGSRDGRQAQHMPTLHIEVHRCDDQPSAGLAESPVQQLPEMTRERDISTLSLSATCSRGVQWCSAKDNCCHCSCSERLNEALKMNEQLVQKLTAARQEAEALRARLLRITGSPDMLNDVAGDGNACLAYAMHIQLPLTAVSPSIAEPAVDSAQMSATAMQLSAAVSLGGRISPIHVHSALGVPSRASGNDGCEYLSEGRAGDVRLVDNSATSGGSSDSRGKDRPARSKLLHRMTASKSGSSEGSGSFCEIPSVGGGSGAFDKLRKLIKGSLAEARSLSRNSNNKKLQLNDEVITRHNRRGHVRFLGHLEGLGCDNTTYVGLQLEEPAGTHDGFFSGKRYFYCEKGHGTFVPMQDIASVVDKKVLHRQSSGGSGGSDGTSYQSEASSKSPSLKMSPASSSDTSSSGCAPTATTKLALRGAGRGKSAASLRHSQSERRITPPLKGSNSWQTLPNCEHQEAHGSSNPVEPSTEGLVGLYA